MPHILIVLGVHSFVAVYTLSVAGRSSNPRDRYLVLYSSVRAIPSQISFHRQTQIVPSKLSSLQTMKAKLDPSDHNPLYLLISICFSPTPTPFSLSLEIQSSTSKRTSSFYLTAFSKVFLSSFVLPFVRDL